MVSGSHKAALIYDGVHLFSRAVENLITETDLTTPQVICDNKDSPYDLGDRLLKEINSVSILLGHEPMMQKWTLEKRYTIVSKMLTSFSAKQNPLHSLIVPKHNKQCKKS